MKVGVVYNTFGGKEMTPEEQEMKEMGLSVGRQLKNLGHDTIFFDVDNPEDLQRLIATDLDVAFTLSERLHLDPFGEAYVPALLESFGIAHTSADSSLIILAIDKPKVKKILASCQIPTPEFQVFSSPDEPLDPRLKFPLIVKGAYSDNSIGLDENSVIDNEVDLRKRINDITTHFGQDALVETFIDGRELSVAILPGRIPLALPISEMIFAELPLLQRICDYKAKWGVNSKFTSQCPAALTPQEEAIVKETALRCYKALGANSYVRVDIRFKDNTAYVLEINPNPSIAEQGCGYVNSVKAYGLSYRDMVDALLKNALNKMDRFPEF